MEGIPSQGSGIDVPKSAATSNRPLQSFSSESLVTPTTNNSERQLASHRSASQTSLPPTRLTESLSTRLGIGQSLLYAKSPLMDPMVNSGTGTYQEPSAVDKAISEVVTRSVAVPDSIHSFTVVSPASYFRDSADNKKAKVLPSRVAPHNRKD